MHVKNTALASAIALALAGGGLALSEYSWADTTTTYVQAVADRAREDGTIYVTAGDTINLATLGLDDELRVDTLGESQGALLYFSVNTEQGKIGVGSNSPGATLNDPDPRIGDFTPTELQVDSTFNDTKYIRMSQGLGRAYVYYPPSVNTPPITRSETDPCCVDPCGADCDDPCGEHDCAEKVVELNEVTDTLTITIYERFVDENGILSFNEINNITKTIQIRPHIPRVSKLDIVGFQASVEDPIRNRIKDPATGETYDPDDFDDFDVDGLVDIPEDGHYEAAQDGIMGMMTAGNGGAQVVIHALRHEPNSASGMVIDKGANGVVTLELVGYEGELPEMPEVEMLNGQAIVNLPAGITQAGDYCLKAKLALPLNGHPDPANSLALPRTVYSTDLYTADQLMIKDTGTVSKLALESLKSIISDDANPPIDAAGNPIANPNLVQAGMNAATAIKVYAMDEYGNKMDFPQDAVNKQVTVVDSAGVVDGSALNLSFSGQMQDMLGDSAGEVLRLGETALVASIEGDASIQPSDPLNIKVTGKNLIAQPYQGADMPYNGERYAGQEFKAFSLAVDGGNPNNGIADGQYNGSPTAVGADDAPVATTGPMTMIVKTYEEGSWNPVEEIQVNLPQQGTVLEGLFTKAVTMDPDPNSPGKSYFIISDRLGNYGEVKVDLPGDIKPGAAQQVTFKDACCEEPHAKEDAPKSCCEAAREEDDPAIFLKPWLDPEDGQYKVILAESNVTMADAYGNTITSGMAGTFVASSSNAVPSLTVVDAHGHPTTPEGAGTDGLLVPGQGSDDCETVVPVDAYVLSYKSSGEGKFAGEDNIVLTFTKAGVEPRTIKTIIPPKPVLTTIKTDIENTTLPVNSQVALTIRALDENGYPINALGKTTVTLSGTILPTATIWRHENETPIFDANGNIIQWEPTKFLKSGDIIRPQGGNKQLLVLDIGSEEGSFTLTFNNEELETTQSVTFNAVPIWSNLGEECSPDFLPACTTAEECEANGGIFEDGICQDVGPQACEQGKGIYSKTLEKCYNLSADEVGLLEVASTDDPSYGGPENEDSMFSGGLLNFTQGAEQFEKGSSSNPVEVSLNDKVMVAGVIQVEPGDEGKLADIVVAGYHKSAIYHEVPGYNIPGGAAWYMLAGCNKNNDPACPAVGWKVKLWPHDEDGFPILSELLPFRTLELPEDGKETVYMYTGNFVYTGPLQMYFGYVIIEPNDIDTGKVVFNQEPIHVNITGE
ncbi:MAG: hypothetical protein SVR94_03120 [Pseudomonadota bacterium]|nr:hypothetical protein [Pseudomonadota bacterium]